MSGEAGVDPVDLKSPASMKALLEADVDGLLDGPEKPKKVTATSRLENAFLEIVEFYRTHGRMPDPLTRGIAERKLGARLEGILASEDRIALLKSLDEFGLLAVPKPPTSIDDLLEGDDLDLLGDEAGLLDVSDFPVRRQIYDNDAAAQRKKSKNFDQFEPLFKRVHAQVREGTSRLLPFPGRQHIVENAFFVLNGVMLFVAEVGQPEYVASTIRTNRRERLRVVFENGTESSMYRQSLSIRLTEGDGQIVAQAEVPEVTEDDQVSGYIYVLRSLSDDPQIASIKDLYKIGFSRGAVANRIKYAEKSATYLMAPVELVASYRTYNLRASALENLVHRVFAEVQLDVSQIDRNGRKYDPSEWFVVPLEVVDQAINFIISGEITDYQYDLQSRSLRARS